MSKTSRTDDGRTLFWCVGCDEHHWIDDSWAITGPEDKPTFSPSVLCAGFSAHSIERTCHSFIREGMIEYLSDCTHSLAGQTVQMVDLEAMRASAETEAA